MNLIFKKVNRGDQIGKFQAHAFMTLQVFCKCCIDLLPLALVLCVKYIDKATVDYSIINSIDFVLTMLFFQLTTIVEIKRGGESRFDMEFDSFKKHLCMLFALIYSVIYTFKYKALDVAIVDEIMLWFAILTVVYALVVRYMDTFSSFLELDAQSGLYVVK